MPRRATHRRQLVDGHLAACANVLPGGQSIYQWEGKVENASETLVFFKTTAARYAALEATLRQLHPYEVPEIIAVADRAGLPEYLRWVSESVRSRVGVT